ncbi:hypothetical protein SCA6_000697 [Theobroma cacao]
MEAYPFYFPAFIEEERTIQPTMKYIIKHSLFIHRFICCGCLSGFVERNAKGIISLTIKNSGHIARSWKESGATFINQCSLEFRGLGLIRVNLLGSRFRLQRSKWRRHKTALFEPEGFLGFWAPLDSLVPSKSPNGFSWEFLLFGTREHWKALE